MNCLLWERTAWVLLKSFSGHQRQAEFGPASCSLWPYLTFESCNWCLMPDYAVGAVIFPRYVCRWWRGFNCLCLSDTDSCRTEVCTSGGRCFGTRYWVETFSLVPVWMQVHLDNRPQRKDREHNNADSLSRLPLNSPLRAEASRNAFCYNVGQIQALPVTAAKVGSCSRLDPQVSRLLHSTRGGWPSSVPLWLEAILLMAEGVDSRGRLLAMGSSCGSSCKVEVPNSVRFA